MNDTVDEDLFKDDCVAVRQDWDVLQQHLRKKGQNLDLAEMPTSLRQVLETLTIILFLMDAQPFCEGLL